MTINANHPYPALSIRHIPLLFILPVLLGTPADAREYIQVTALDTTEAARTLGMGGAGSALGRDSSLIWMNPSALAGGGSGAILAGYMGLTGEVTMQGIGAFNYKDWTLCLGGVWADSGKLSLLDSDGNEVNQTLQRDVMVILGAGRPLGDLLTAGLAVKGQRSDLLDLVPDYRIVVDVGAQVKAFKTLKLGIAVRNFGSGMVLSGYKAESRTEARGGVAYRIDWPGSLHPDGFILAADAVYSFADDEFVYPGGLEIWWQDIFAIRIGGHYSETKTLGNLSLGLCAAGGSTASGFKRFRLEYATRLVRETDSYPHTISLTFGF